MPAPVYLVTVPRREILPIDLFPPLVNHSAPSGPFVMAFGSSMAGLVKTVTFPVMVILPIAPGPDGEIIPIEHTRKEVPSLRR